MRATKSDVKPKVEAPLVEADSLPLGSVVETLDHVPSIIIAKQQVNRLVGAGMATRVEKQDVLHLLSESYGVREVPATSRYKLPAASFDVPKWRHSQIAHTANHIGMTPGADPEFFVSDADGSVIPAWEFLPSKEKPLGLASGQGEAYWDGLQAEWRITHMTGICLDRFTGALYNSLRDLLGVAVAKFPKAHLDIRSVVDVEPSLLRTELEPHVMFGCQGSENVYGIKGRTDENPREVPIRFAGGHMHFGLNGNHSRWGVSRALQQEIVGAVKMLDAVVGVALVSMSEGYDDVRRREYYGLAGEYRLPKHGLEYRVPSNFWLCARPIAYLVWDVARWAVNAGCMGLRDAYDATDAEVIAAINGNDVKLARTILQRNEDVFRGWLAYYAAPGAELAWETLLGGPKAVGLDPADILHNWALGRWSDCAYNAYQRKLAAKAKAPKPEAASSARRSM